MRTLHPERTALLASVLSAEEVPAALSGGADIMDVKNPAEGALGAPSPATVRAVRAATPAELHVSAALGDMPDLPGTAALAAVGAASAGASIVKVGLYGPSTEEAVCRLLGTVAAALAAESPATALVAGVYADAPLFKGINPLSVPRCAAEAGVAGCLLDTYDKRSGMGLRDLLPTEKIKRFLDECRREGLFTALAGSLRPSDIPHLLPLAPHYLGFRGALCGGSRTGRVAEERVAHIASLIADGARPAARH